MYYAKHFGEYFTGTISSNHHNNKDIVMLFILEGEMYI